MKKAEFSGTGICLRRADIKDLDAISLLFRETVIAVNSRDYSPQQIRIWAARSEDKGRWKEKINTQYFLVAETAGGKIAGFASVTNEGYLDFLFTGKDHQGMGVATQLLTALENFARVNNYKTEKITTDVSITAKPFFEKHGFRVIKQQTVFLDDVAFINFKMEKEI